MSRSSGRGRETRSGDTHRTVDGVLRTHGYDIELRGKDVTGGPIWDEVTVLNLVVSADTFHNAQLDAEGFSIRVQVSGSWTVHWNKFLSQTPLLHLSSFPGSPPPTRD